MRSFYFVITIFLSFVQLGFSQLLDPQTYVPTPMNMDIITYQYHYSSILLLDESIEPDTKKDWYISYRDQINNCMKNFNYPEDLNASIPNAMEAYRKECHYKTILEMNNFENNLYFEGKKPLYNIYASNPIFANILAETLDCTDCSLYPKRNSDIIFLETPYIPTGKIRMLSLNPTQERIFSTIFSIKKDTTRVIQTSKEIIIRWANKINAAHTRSHLKLVLDDFVNHIEFKPIETKEQIIATGEKIYNLQKSE